ncbi:MAG: anthranilate synthase component 1 [Myxococcota bacterium]
MSGAAPHISDGQVAIVSRRVDADIDPVSLYVGVTAARPDTLLLESAEPQAKRAGQSVLVTQAALRIAAAPIRDSHVDREVTIEALTLGGRNLLPVLERELRASARVTAEGAGLRVLFSPAPADLDERRRLVHPNPLDVLRHLLGSLEIVEGDRTMAPLCAGSIAYDFLGAFEDLPPPRRDPLGWPELEMWLAEEVVRIDHHRHQATFARYAYGGAADRDARVYHDAVEGLGRTLEVWQRLDAGIDEEATAASHTSPPEVDVDDATFRDQVEAVKKHIVLGDVFQLVLSRCFSRNCTDAVAAYGRLRAIEPSPYMFFVRGSAGVLFGASPESAVRVESDRTVTISPIAGTRRRARHPDGSIDHDLDSRLEAELRLDEKEVAEHMMLVDLARNDVARVSEQGSRRVSQLLNIVRYSRVMHLVSEVRGQLREGLDALHAYLATMNMGTLVGAPKVRAAQLIRQFEPERRGPYGGVVGYLTADGIFDTCIVIRSAVVKDGVAYVRAGAGIVADSDPQSEADETRRKAAAVLSILD